MVLQDNPLRCEPITLRSFKIAMGKKHHAEYLNHRTKWSVFHGCVELPEASSKRQQGEQSETMQAPGSGTIASKAFPSAPRGDSPPHRPHIDLMYNSRYPISKYV